MLRFGLVSQAATIKSFAKNIISNYAISSEEVDALKYQVQALTDQLQQKTIYKKV